MRCPQCNVDLSEGVKACPLCGGAAEASPARIPGMRTAEYPVITYRKYPKNYAGMYCGAALALCLLGAVVELLLTRSLDITILVAGGLSCLWFAVLWPVSRKGLPLGKYLFVNLCTLSLLMLHLGAAADMITGVAVVFMAESLLYLGVIVLKKERRERNAVYLLCMAAAELALLVFALIKSGGVPWLPCLALVLTGLDLLLVFVLARRQALAELKAFFHA